MSFQPTGESWHSGSTSTGGRAGFFQRLVADLIDGIILVIVGGIIAAVLHTGVEIIIIPISVAYFSLLEGGVSGQTIGKKAIRIRVVSLEDGQPIGYGRALLRDIARFLSEIPIFLGYLWMLWSPERQTWHDMIAKAVVVPASSEPRQPKGPW